MNNIRPIIEFCRNQRCCPVVTILDENKISLGDKDGPEGETIWTKQQFKDFVQAVMDGKFNEILKEETI